MKTFSTKTVKMHRVSFVKNFLSGPLAGQSVKTSYVCDAERCCQDQLRLNDATPDNPSKDLITGSEWWASGVGCEETEIPFELVKR